MIGIIGAMEEEVRELIADMQECEMNEKASMKFYKGKLYGKDAVVVQSGIGKVNAAICTQILADCYHVDEVINTGVAGSLDAEINIGDIVISTDAVHHDMDVSALGDPVGQVPRMDVFAFPADKELAEKAMQANKKANPEIRTFMGRVASGDQFISKKEGTQEEFFHTFNALYESNKQIIISSDRPPKEIKTLEDRLRSRFEWGLIADVQPPDYETRIAILKKKAERDNLTVPDDVMAYIAKNIASNIRELEGALTRIVAFATLTNQDISIALAENSLKDIFSENSATPLTPELIQQVVAEYYNIRVEDIQGSKKPKNIAFPRQVSMYLCRKLLDISLPKIGESFGGRDHTTVIYAISKIEKQLESDEGLQKTVHALEKEIKES